jgi:hypothetical protein
MYLSGLKPLKINLLRIVYSRKNSRMNLVTAVNHFDIPDRNTLVLNTLKLFLDDFN